MLKEEAHTQKTADAAVGLGTDDRRSLQTVAEPDKEAMEDVER